MCTDLQNNNQWWEFPLKRAHWINTINTGLVCEIMALKIRKHSLVHLNAWTTLSCTPKTRQKTKLKSCAECKVYRSWKNLLLWGEAHTLFQAVKGGGGGTHLRPPPTPHRAVAVRWQFRLETIVKRESSFEALLSRSSEKFSRISIRSFKGRFYIPASQCQHTVAAVLLMYSKTLCTCQLYHLQRTTNRATI